jgi:hypothetical protein
MATSESLALKLTFHKLNNAEILMKVYILKYQSIGQFVLAFYNLRKINKIHESYISHKNH